jgi:hypothetical protein
MTKPQDLSIKQRCVRFVFGLALLGGFFAVVVGVPHPGGAAGAFLDQTEAMDIQATALFYADLEQYYDIEGRLWGDDGYRALAERERSEQEQETAETSEE